MIFLATLLSCNIIAYTPLKRSLWLEYRGYGGSEMKWIVFADPAKEERTKLSFSEPGSNQHYKSLIPMNTDF